MFQVKFMSLMLLVCALMVPACDKKEKDDNSLLYLLFMGPLATYTADGVSFAMAYVPGGKTFPVGIDDNGDIDGFPGQDVLPTATVSSAYWIGETEVTYELWYRVYTWAIDPARGANLYTFAFTAGDEPRAGDDGTPGSGTASQEPVTYVSWRHAMVWCNALTEWYNAQSGADYQCVYCTDSGYTLPIRSADTGPLTYPDPGGQDDPYVNTGAKGFRLLTSYEWELAARWRNDATNTVSGYSNPWFTKGNSASHATTYYNDVTGAPNYAGKLANDLVAVYYRYWDGDSWELTGVTGTAAVKSKTAGANSLGLYDMSGNVDEWCFDWHPVWSGSYRVRRGGSWIGNAYTLQAGIWYNYVTYAGSDDLGFRFARTQ